MIRRPRVVLYPFLAAAYSVLALAGGNPGELPGLWVLKWPLCISLLFTAGAWLLTGLFVRNLDRRAFVTLILVTLFASYGYIAIALGELPWFTSYAHGVLPFLVVVSYLSALTYLAFRLLPDLRKLTRFLTLFTTVLVLWNSLDLLRYTFHWNDLHAQPESNRPKVQTSTVPGHGGPDIYLIVLDKYTGRQSLTRNFGFDNKKFETFLADRHFVLPRAARANYIYTNLALAALLNYRYLDELPAHPKAQNRNKNYLNHLIEDSAVLRFLRARGYRFVFFPTAYPFTAGNRFADLQLPDPAAIPSEFEVVWRWTTLAEPVVIWVCRRINCSVAAAPFMNDPKLLNWKFEQLSQLARRPRDGRRPLFVLAHLTVPHEPYVFQADCTAHAPIGAPYGVVQDESPEKKAYIAQITCLNLKLQHIVDCLLHDSPTPPVILLQADHGHGRMPLHIPEMDAVTADRVAERTDVFAAYYLPGVEGKIVYDSISPVNLFRTVFREYFHSDLGPLPDQSYWSSWSNPFQFTKVSERAGVQ